MGCIDDAATLIEVLNGRAAATPSVPAFSCNDTVTTFAELWAGIGRFAASLLRGGVAPTDRVILALPNGEDFFFAFYGVVRAGGIAVPVFPGSGARRVATIARLCSAAAIVVPPSAGKDDIDLLATSVPPGRVLTVDRGNGFESCGDDLPHPVADDICFIQYTSGSTGNPKGVQLSHRNLLTNIRQMIAGMEITEEDVFVSWLPVHHDMGLILMTMVPFCLAARLILLPTSLVSIRRWMETIHRYRGTFTAAPDFAYRLALRYVKDAGALDLSCLRVALNAAEPVRARTIEQFEQVFGLRQVMVPGYGLAEATVGVSMAPPGSKVVVDSRGLVALGRPFPGVEIEIAGEDGPEPIGTVGEIMVRSPATTCGYYDNPEETARLLRADGFLHTGDLGYQDQRGNVYFVSRKKNIIIHAGRNVAPQEVEETVESLPFVRASAAVGVDRGRTEGEQVYLFVEVRAAEASDPAVWQRLAIGVVQCFNQQLGFRPGRVYLLKPRSIPMTHNSKVRHAELKQRYLDGDLRAAGSILFPEY